jgi:rhomboid protease GluP
VLCTSCGVLVGVNDDKCYNCGRSNPGLWGFAPALRSLGQDLGFVPFVIGTCAVIYALAMFYTVFILDQPIGMGGLFTILSPSIEANYVFGASGTVPVFRYGRWWTVLSAGWLHGGVLHILFNMSVVRQMAPAVAEVFGPGRMVIVYTMGSIAGFALSSFAGAYLPPLPSAQLVLLSGSPFTVGASASIAGLIGAILFYGRRSGSGMARSYASRYVVMLVVIGFFPGIDNYAHAGGFAGGYLTARFLDPLKPERVDHVAIAIGCLALSLLSVVYSVISGLPS